MKDHKESGRPAPRARAIEANRFGVLDDLPGRAAKGAALGVIALVAGFIMCGCGASADDEARVRVTTPSKSASSRGADNSRTEVLPASTKAKTAVKDEEEPVAKSHAVANAPAPAKPAEGEKASGMAPDIVAAVSDTVAAPGQILFFSVRGTEDVSQIVLRDGLGDSQGLVYDDVDKLWRVSYRVPLSAPQDRMGLSLTARNRDGRWCRVWTFIRVREEPVSKQIELTVGS